MFRRKQNQAVLLKSSRQIVKGTVTSEHHSRERVVKANFAVTATSAATNHAKACFETVAKQQRLPVSCVRSATGRCL